ncbi:hypothetical protein K469DRAFT_724003 [Zopfia rhizophila CBS 207.26]|uniref:Opioid growth factor receptor (OGFr) conserved domain-containing protein n=1 Tax=Zopfia rhizophila CBS 207.26 TaxID=1314779 RepID=A0A6A6EF69_9PEZI|nr:hypothetical protein K469DRAFT_724003 [Zopfia rhizophila CBS 207.26]
MTSPEPISPKLFARDIAAYSDAELDRYLEETRRDRAHSTTETEEPYPEDDYHQLWETGSALTKPLDEEEEYRESLQRETEAYHALVKDGGRPSHPLSLLEDIVKNPGEYREILSWKSFRRFQRFVREPNIEDERIIYISGQYRRWDHFEGRFPIYVRAVKDRLTKHGFTRTFQLDEDPARQDKLTTWIEYLGYEYWWPFKTQKFICSIESGFMERSERERAEAAVESAKSAVMLLEAQSKLDAAVNEYDLIKRRHNLIYGFTEGTKNNRFAKRNAERHSILLRWMLQQLPLIELELKQSDTAGNDSDGRGRKRRLKLDRAGELGKGQGPTDQSSDDGENPTTSDRRTCIASTSQGGERRKRRSHDTVDEERPSKRSRHNGPNLCLSDRKTSESVDTTAATGGSHGSKTAAARTGGRGVKAGNFSSPGHSLRSRKKSTLDTPQPSTATKSLRRSTRIAEREQQLAPRTARGSTTLPWTMIFAYGCMTTIRRTGPPLGTMARTKRRCGKRRHGSWHTSLALGTDLERSRSIQVALPSKSNSPTTQQQTFDTSRTCEHSSTSTRKQLRRARKKFRLSKDLA